VEATVQPEEVQTMLIGLSMLILYKWIYKL
jgi:hypothetical protein